jgi:tellurite methyltransferase
MSRADRDRWDTRYATADARSAPPHETLRWLPPAADRQHLVLDLACGTGRHTRALLDAGYRVVAADISRVALARLRASLSARSCAALVQIDAEGWPFAEASFDIIVQIDFLDREALTSIRRTVKPGGLLLIDTFAGEPLPGGPGPQRSAWRLAPGEITARFADWEVLRVSDDPGQERSAVLARRPRG